MKLIMEHVGNSTYVLQCGELKIAIDPALAPKGSGLGFGIFRATEPKYKEDTFQNIDIWLLTHPHLDHLDEEGIGVISKDSLKISAPSNKKILLKNKVNNVVYLDWNETTTYKKDLYTIRVTAIPAYHGQGSLIVKMMGKVNGYWLEIEKQGKIKSIYITSDTIYNTSVVHALQKYNEVDLLIACLGEAKAPLPVTRKPITMDNAMLSKFQKLLKPKYTVGIHIDDYTHFRTRRNEISQSVLTPKNGEILEFNL